MIAAGLTQVQDVLKTDAELVCIAGTARISLNLLHKCRTEAQGAHPGPYIDQEIDHTKASNPYLS